jgi:predicted DNA-binding transcriptional regulator YafY
MVILSEIISAIKSRRKIEIDYKGEGPRLICPHACYVSSKGKTLVDSYQIAGYSNHREQVPGWRPFDLSEISSLRIMEETFEEAPGYNPLSDRYSNALAML